MPEALNTSSAERLVSLIAMLTAEMFDASIWVPAAAICTFWEISRVAAPCCSMALAIAVVTSSISRMDSAISLTEATAVVVVA